MKISIKQKKLTTIQWLKKSNQQLNTTADIASTTTRKPTEKLIQLTTTPFPTTTPLNEQIKCQKRNQLCAVQHGAAQRATTTVQQNLCESIKQMLKHLTKQGMKTQIELRKSNSEQTAAGISQRILGQKGH